MGFLIFSGFRARNFDIFIPRGIGFWYFQAPGYRILEFSGPRVWDFGIFRPQGMGFWYFQASAYRTLVFPTLKGSDLGILVLRFEWRVFF